MAHAFLHAALFVLGFAVVVLGAAWVGTGLWIVSDMLRKPPTTKEE